MKIVKALITLILVAAIIAGTVYLYNNPPKSEVQQQQRGPAPVVVAEVKRVPFVDTVEALGTAKAKESVTLSAKVTETLKEIAFEEGQLVRKGDLLVKLSRDEITAQLEEAKANLEEQQKQLERAKQVVGSGGVAQSVVDEEEALYEGLQARLRTIESRLRDRVIEAPFDGVLGLRDISEGTLVTPGTPIIDLHDISVIKADFTVPETYYGALEIGQEVAARSVAYPDKRFRGTISTIGTQVDPVTRAFTARALIPNDEKLLRPGMLLRVEVIKNRRNVLVIPEEAVMMRQDRKFVLTVDENNTVGQSEVALGGRLPGIVEVSLGVKEGDRVIAEGQQRARPGAQVNIVGETDVEDHIEHRD